MTESASQTVLVIDDEPDVADSYAAQIVDRYGVRTAYSGEEALAKLDADVDVVLLDRRMPDIFGDEVLATIRERGPDCRVAMVTAIDADFDIIDMPFDEYVVKPVTREELLETIDRLLRCAEYESQLREFYRVNRKYVALQSAKSGGELANNEEFRRLETRREQLAAELESTIEGLEDEDFETLLGNLRVERPEAA